MLQGHGMFFRAALVGLTLMAATQAAVVELPSTNVPSGYKVLMYSGADVGTMASTPSFEDWVFYKLCIRATELTFIQSLTSAKESDRLALLTTAADTSSLENVIQTTETLVFYSVNRQSNTTHIDLVCTTDAVVKSDMMMVLAVAASEQVEKITLTLDRKFSFQRLRAVQMIKETLNSMLEKQRGRSEAAKSQLSKSTTARDVMISTAEDRILDVYSKVESFNNDVKTCITNLPPLDLMPNDLKADIAKINATAEALQADIDALLVQRVGKTGQDLFNVEMRLRDLYLQQVHMKNYAEATHHNFNIAKPNAEEDRRETCNSEAVDKVWNMSVDRGRFNQLGFVMVGGDSVNRLRDASNDYTTTLTTLAENSVFQALYASRYPVTTLLPSGTPISTGSGSGSGTTDGGTTDPTGGGTTDNTGGSTDDDGSGRGRDRGSSRWSDL